MDTSSDPVRFAKNLKDVRKRLKITQEQTAPFLGIPIEKYRLIERATLDREEIQEFELDFDIPPKELQQLLQSKLDEADRNREPASNFTGSSEAILDNADDIERHPSESEISDQRISQFGSVLRELRTLSGLSQAALAESVGVYQRDISNYENDSRRPNAKTLRRLSEFFHIPLDSPPSEKIALYLGSDVGQELRFNEHISRFVDDHPMLSRFFETINGSNAPDGDPYYSANQSSTLAERLSASIVYVVALPNEAIGDYIQADFENAAANVVVKIVFVFGFDELDNDLAAVIETLGKPVWLHRLSGDEPLPNLHEDIFADLVRVISDNNFPFPSTDAADDLPEHSKNLDVAREASEEQACIGVRGYAHVLSTFLRSIRGEFTMALYGPWGRGKSYLVDFVEKELSDSQIKLIRFNAWKYKTAPETWAHLYETFLNAAKSGNWRQDMGLALRSGLLRHGRWPFEFAILLAFLALLPSTISVQALIVVVTTFGVTISFVMWRMSNVGRRLIQDLQDRYFRFSSHEDKLGLQAAIGRDLSALLRAWIPGDADKISFRRLGILGTLLVGAVIAISAYEPTLTNRVFRSRLSFTHPIVFAAISWWALFFFLFWVAKATQRVEQILLVVDDLDRCDLTLMLDVIESIRLMLEEPEIERRVKVLMLIDERILDEAILLRYRKLSSRNDDPETLIREQKEKLFLCHLKLPPLTDDDVRELVTTYTDQEGRKKLDRASSARKELDAATDYHQYAQKHPVTTSTTTHRNKELDDIAAMAGSVVTDAPGPMAAGNARMAGAAAAAAARRETREVDNLTPATERLENARQRSSEAEVDFPDAGFDPQTVELGFPFTDAEVQAIRTAIDESLRNNSDNHWTCRSVRTVLIRYQLGRLLLNIRRQDISPKMLCRTLLHLNNTNHDSVYERIKDEVA